MYSDVYVDILGLMAKCDTSSVHCLKTKLLRMQSSANQPFLGTEFPGSHAMSGPVQTPQMLGLYYTELPCYTWICTGNTDEGDTVQNLADFKGNVDRAYKSLGFSV